MTFGNSSLSLSLYAPVAETASDWAEWHPANFEAVIEQHQTRIYRYIYLMVGEVELAQDLTQDTFIQAYRHLQKRTLFSTQFEVNRYSSIQPNMTAWLYTIARNRTLSEIRRRKKIKFLPFSGLHRRDGSESEDFDPAAILTDHDQGNPETWLGLKDELQRVIQQVGPQKLTPLLLFMDGFSYLEICQITNDSLANVKVKIFRAKALLREALKKSG